MLYILSNQLSRTPDPCLQPFGRTLIECDQDKGIPEMADQKPRGRLSAYAFFVEKAEEDFKREHPNEEIVFTEFSRGCIEKWKKMSESEKLEYFQLADENTKRLQENPYVPPENVQDEEVKRDPDLPKPAHSVYYYFCVVERPKVMADPPAGKDHEYVPKELYRRFHDLSSAEKAKYEELAAKDMIRFEKEMAIYMEKKAKKPSTSIEKNN